MSHNPITGDLIATRATSDAYRDGHDRIFGKKVETETVYYWPDGGWCYVSDLEGMLSWRSDDFGTIEVPLDHEHDAICAMVDQRVNS